MLVIIGLLVGGVLTGQAMIKSSEVRAAITDMQQFVSAHTAFREQYNALPGDFNAATRYWGRQNGNADCITNFSAALNADTGVCDGDSGGTISSDSGASTGQSAEEFQYWRHLQMAGLISGNYSGLKAVNTLDPGVNVPATKRAGGNWRIYNLGDTTTTSGSGLSTFALPFYNTISGSTDFTAEEIWNMDKKIDDGMPAAGSAILRPWSSCSTASARTDLTAEYALNNPSKGCLIQWRNLR